MWLRSFLGLERGDRSGAGSAGLGQACSCLEAAPGLGGIVIRVEREQRGAQACGGDRKSAIPPVFPSREANAAGEAGLSGLHSSKPSPAGGVELWPRPWA